jgi:hypothetical protein
VNASSLSQSNRFNIQTTTNFPRTRPGEPTCTGVRSGHIGTYVTGIDKLELAPPAGVEPTTYRLGVPHIGGNGRKW